VADDEHRGPTLLGEAHQPRGAFAHLTDVARRSLEIRCEHGLDRIDDEHRGRRRCRGGEHRLEVGLAQQRDVAGVLAESVGAQLDLERTLLARCIERRTIARLEARCHLQEERRLPDAWLAADEDHRARDDAAAEDEVELVDPGLPAARLASTHFTKSRRHRDAASLGQRARSAGAATRAARGSTAHRDFLDERVPRAAHVAPASPLGMFGAALRAAVDGLGLGAHARSGSMSEK